jgi:hypothetical protein
VIDIMNFYIIYLRGVSLISLPVHCDVTRLRINSFVGFSD